MMKRRFKALTGLFAALCIAATLSACGSDDDSGGGSDGGSGGGDKKLDSLTFAIASPAWNAGYTTLIVPQVEGFFKDEGLDVKIALFPSGTQTAQQLAAGGADVGVVTGEPVAIGHDKDLNLIYFATYWPKWIYSMMVPEGSDIDSVADLKGKSLGVTSVASSGRTFARTAMELDGMDPDSAKFVPIGVGAQQLNAVKDGKVDALALWDTQYAILEGAGVKLTPLTVPQVADSWGGGFAVTKETLENKKDVIERFGRAIAKSFAFTTANPEAAIHDLWKARPETRGSGPEDAAMDKALKVLNVRIANQGVEEDNWGGIDKKAAQDMVDFMASAKLINKSFPATDIYTTDLLKAINDFDYDAIRQKAKDAS